MTLKRYPISSDNALLDLANNALIDDAGNVLIFHQVYLSPLFGINGFYVDAKGGMHYTYINVETGESFDQ